jgi:hypothetical protein
MCFLWLFLNLFNNTVSAESLLSHVRNDGVVINEKWWLSVARDVLFGWCSSFGWCIGNLSLRNVQKDSLPTQPPAQPTPGSFSGSWRAESKADHTLQSSAQAEAHLHVRLRFCGGLHGHRDNCAFLVKLKVYLSLSWNTKSWRCGDKSPLFFSRLR